MISGKIMYRYTVICEFGQRYIEKSSQRAAFDKITGDNMDTASRY